MEKEYKYIIKNIIKNEQQIYFQKLELNSLCAERGIGREWERVYCKQNNILYIAYNIQGEQEKKFKIIKNGSFSTSHKNSVTPELYDSETPGF